MKNLNQAQASTAPTGTGVNQTKQSNTANQSSNQSGAEQAPSIENRESPNSKSAANTIHLQNGRSAISNAAIGRRIGAASVLPGESGEKYYQGFAHAIEALGAKTVFEVYWVEKIFQCLWSMNRYELQKRSCLISEMVKALKSKRADDTEEQLLLRRLLESGAWDDPDLNSIVESNGFTAQSLTQWAMERRIDEVAKYEQMIALKVQSLVSMQKQFEALVSRSVMHERLKLQNELLKRDLHAIDVTAVQSVATEPMQGHEKQGGSVSSALAQDLQGPSDVLTKDAKPKTLKTKPQATQQATQQEPQQASKQAAQQLPKKAVGSCDAKPATGEANKPSSF